MNRRALFATPVVFALLAFSCGSDDGADDGPLPSGFYDRLTNTGGCGDIFVYASNQDDTISLSFRADGLVEEAHAQGVETTSTIVLTDTNEGYVVNATTGQHTSADFCTDALIETPIISTRWRSTAGTVTVTVTPGDTIEESRATVSFEDVTLEPVASPESPVTIRRFEITDVSVGWLPG